MNLLSRITGPRAQRALLDDLGLPSMWTGLSMVMGGTKQLAVGNDFESYVHQVARKSVVVAAAVAARSLLVSQIRFQWRSASQADRGRLFGTESLATLEGPERPFWLKLAEQHVCYAGTAYLWVDPTGKLQVLRPDYMRVLLQSDLSPRDPGFAADMRVEGYIYDDRRSDPVMLSASEVAVWAPEPDPLAPWRGESWITSVLREITQDGQATDHLSKFYENGTTPPLIFSLDAAVNADQAKQYAALLKEQQGGVANAYKPLVIGGGADVQVVGSNIQQLNYRETQGGHETRIASRSRVPAVVLGISEGMQGSALNAGNYSQTRRLWADGWFTPHADSLCAALERIVEKPAGGPSELSYDPTRIMFLQEDEKDAADIAQVQSVALRQLVEGGFDPTSAIEAVTTGDMSKLTHTGKLSVQLQDATTTEVTDGNP